MANTTINKNVRVGGLTAFALYFGIGAITHLIFLGATIDWSSAWTYAVVLGWPLIVLAVIAAGMLVVALGCFLILGIASFVEHRQNENAAARRTDRDARLAKIKEDRAEQARTLN